MKLEHIRDAWSAVRDGHQWMSDHGFPVRNLSAATHAGFQLVLEALMELQERVERLEALREEEERRKEVTA